MAHSSSIFSRMPIELPNRSGFDMSHENMGTGQTATLYPVLVDELLPNDTVSLGANLQVQLPPMVTDFYGRVDYVLEAFFVPCRLLWGGWESFMTHPTAGAQYPSGTPVLGKSKYLPRIKMSQEDDPAAFDNFMSAGSLSDYLGVRAGFSSDETGALSYEFNMLPYLAYHRIYDDWYRDSRIQTPLFYRPDSTLESDQIDYGVAFKPYVSGGVYAPDITNVTLSPDNVHSFFYDGTNIASLRQRNFAKDYFTTASTLPQAGNAATLTFEVDDQNTGTFSIAALRSANSLQKWMERNNIAGYRYSDQIYAQYGIYPSDAIMDKCIYLGRHVENVYTRSVYQSAPTNGNSGGKNPFDTVGAKFGSSQVVGSGSLVDNIRVTEHGYLFVMASLVPHANYSSGIRRYLKRGVVGDFAFPLLSGMGDQAIMASELDSTYGAFSETFGENLDQVFGYTDLYAEYKYHDDEVHGLLADGYDLENFALQRSFRGSPTKDSFFIDTGFLQIPTNYLDQVLSVSTSESGYSHWYDIYFAYKKISTLPEYSLPTLADLKNVHTKYISRGGKRL